MFVKSVKTHYVKGVSAVTLLALSVAGAAAAETPVWKSKGGTIPISVTLDDVKSTSGPIYISIQKRSEYMGMKGHGGMLPEATLGEMKATFKVDQPGDYSISVWHDVNDDGIFSMSETYQILDGWGNSAAIDVEGQPTFDDVKISVPANGADVTVKMKYPS